MHPAACYSRLPTHASVRIQRSETGADRAAFLQLTICAVVETSQAAIPIPCRVSTGAVQPGVLCLLAHAKSGDVRNKEGHENLATDLLAQRHDGVIGTKLEAATAVKTYLGLYVIDVAGGNRPHGTALGADATGLACIRDKIPAGRRLPAAQ